MFFFAFNPGHSLNLPLLVKDIPIVGGWYYSFFVNPSPVVLKDAFLILYLFEIALCCGFFGVVQLYYIFKGRFSGGIEPLVAALAAGAIGMKAIFSCGWPSILFSGQFWWFILSDVAMFFVAKYFEMRQVRDSGLTGEQ